MGPRRILRPARTSFHPPGSPEGLPRELPVDLPATASALFHQMPLPKKLQSGRCVRKRPYLIPVFLSELKNTSFGGTAPLQRGFEDLVRPSANERSKFGLPPLFRLCFGPPANSTRRLHLPQLTWTQPSGFSIFHPMDRYSCELRSCGERPSHRMENMPS